MPGLLNPDPGAVLVRVSAASMQLPFQGCDPEYIRTTCHGRCCHIKSHPQGTVIRVERDQQPGLRKLGAQFDAEGVMRTYDRRCVFHTDAGLCGLHGTEHKPRSCIQSPFILTKRDTLIVRNRYKRLICFKAEPKLPAYKAFASALVLLFGADIARIITQQLDAKPREDVITYMLADRYKFAHDVAHVWGLE
jgi:hypothetical protein